MSRVGLHFVIVLFPDQTHLLFDFTTISGSLDLGLYNSERPANQANVGLYNNDRPINQAKVGIYNNGVLTNQLRV